MLKTEYLYGIGPGELENKFYYEALAYKLEHAKILHAKLYVVENKTFEEESRLFWVRKAMDHTTKLLREREEL